MKQITNAYREALKLHGLTQAEFARRNGVAGSELTRMCQGKYPSDKLLGALARGWPDRETGDRLLLAHLRNECARSGETDRTVLLG